MKDGFIRVGSASPEVRVADTKYNADRIIETAEQADEMGVSLLVFPELCITGYTCGDLFNSKVLLDSAKAELARIAYETSDLDITLVVGLPLAVKGKLYNTAAVVAGGRIAGFVPKRNIPNYSEFYEARYFTPYTSDEDIYINSDEFETDDDCGIYMGPQIFCSNAEGCGDFRFAVEICEDLWVAHSPSEDYCREGALIICNPSASDEVIGKRDYRRKLVEIQSGKLACGYIYADCGFGESTQDLVFSGHRLICENGSVLSESKSFTTGLTCADIDTERLVSERRRMNTYPAAGQTIGETSFAGDVKDIVPERHFSPYPFVPSDSDELDSRCEEIITMQATGLATRLKAINCKTAVIGLSGGLDSTLALIVTVHAFDMLSLDRSGILAVTMPCFGTTARTKSNALTLAQSYGTQIRTVDITRAVRQHFADIGQSEDDHDVTFENSQARERTQVLMDLANSMGGLVIGTGDLSELALGWATYNGDHMSMYGVNCSIPKTLVRHLVAYEARTSGSRELTRVLEDVLDTPVSPELLPPTEDGTISQKTEDIVGPYELHDFFLYYLVRFGFAPSKIYRMAKSAFAERYDDDTVMKWLKTFVRRFFTQQFKRSCLPDGPKVGSVALSPRGDWRMPSDASVGLWLEELEENT